MNTFRTRKRKSETTTRARGLRQGDNMAEALLWNELKNRKLDGYKFVRQAPLGPYFADFLCRERSLVVEVDGSQHAGSSYDAARDGFMRNEGYSVIRFWSHDVITQRESVCRTILAALEGSIRSDVSSPDLRFVRAAHGS